MPDNNLLDIKKRVTAAKQTRKITGTMELIASSRLYQGRTLLENYTDWATHLRAAARCLPDCYFVPRAGADIPEQQGYVVFAGSKGLSGSYASNLVEFAAPLLSGQLMIAVGSATEPLEAETYQYFDDETPTAECARAIAQCAKTLYESGAVGAVSLVYTRGTQLLCKRLLPLERDGAYNDSVLIEPSKKQLYPVLLEEYMEMLVYEAYLHAFVAEQIARVSAMDSATQNADEIIEQLQHTYNRIRQANITQEITTVSNVSRGGGAKHGT